MKNLGEFTAGKTIVTRFNTHKADGTPITLAGTPAISVYKTGSTTETTTGVSLTVDYDSRTGLHYVAIDTSADGTFYASGADFDVVITAGTVDSISVVGTVVATFSIANRAPLRPTVADRTLAVASTGEASADATKINGVAASSVTTINANIGTTQPVNYTGTGASAVVKSETTSMATDSITSSAVAASAITEIHAGLSTLDAAGVRTAVGLASANLDTQLSTIAGYMDTEVAAIKAKTDNLPASPAATSDIPTVAQIWTTVLTESYRSTGAAGTAAQLMHEILQNITEFAISGSTKTVKKFDGVTTAKTYTLDSATAPTSITEAT